MHEFLIVFWKLHGMSAIIQFGGFPVRPQKGQSAQLLPLPGGQVSHLQERVPDQLGPAVRAPSNAPLFGVRRDWELYQLQRLKASAEERELH